jgi:hypothetical protein
MSFALLSAAFLLSCAAFPGSAAPKRGATPAGQEKVPTPEEYEAMGRMLIEEFAAGAFEKAVARFDDAMAQALPLARMESVWKSLQEQFGPFQKMTAARRQAGTEMRIVIVGCAFERAELDARIVFDTRPETAGRVRGLNFTPKFTWAAPAYTKPELFAERAATVGTERWPLPATFTVPTGAGPFPTVVLVHGSGPHDQDETFGPLKPFKDLAWGLASRGIAVLRYVKRTRQHGRALAAQGGAFTMHDETVEDARAAVAWLAKQPEVDAKRIFVLGHSQGAYLAPRIAEMEPPPAALILMAGFTRPFEALLVEQVRYLTGRDGKVTEDEEKALRATEDAARQIADPNLAPDAKVTVLGSSVPGSYFRDLRGYDPAQAAARVAQQSVRILVLQGERDYQVTMADFEGWKQALARLPQAQLKSYPALNHFFVAGSGPSSPDEYLRGGHVEEEVIRDIAAWILGPRGGTQ